MSLYFSGVQPTGHLHLGNYLGAINSWTGIQKNNNCLFCIVDMHAITIPQNPMQLRQSIIEMAAIYIACGIDESSIFVQSTIHEHAELSWILSCLTPIGWLNRMTQYKDKTAKNQQNCFVGLYTYPMLMAADILLYKASHVPAGEDQRQHVEITRDIATAFNQRYETNFFSLPEFITNTIGTKIMSLRNGLSKMSKSDPSELARINLIDDNDVISKKIQKAKTDSLPIPVSTEELSARPEVKNLMTIMSCLIKQSIQSTLNQYAGKDTSIFKRDLTQVLTEQLTPIRTRYFELLRDKSYLNNCMLIGHKKAKAIAANNMSEIRRLVGFY